jgi:hypothetical protein
LQTTDPNPVTVRQQRHGRGTRVTTYSGASADAVMAAAMTAWQNADPWLRAEKPAVWRDELTGECRAHVVVWSAE